MPKKNNRDDFSPETIRNAAQRVCYQCSICSCLTSSASQKSSNDVLSIGVAAHICAASPNGPRYNPSQTAEERKSIDNCIWLCQTHSRMIDEDVETYTVENLKTTKINAETRVNEALTKGLTFSKDVQSGGFTPEKTFEILNSLMIEGDFLKLQLYLDSMKEIPKSLELLDIYNFFNIVYQFYCNRANINSSIENYLRNNVKNYVNNLVDLFAQFSEKQLLLLVVDYCTDAKLKKICGFILDDKLDNNVFVKEKKGEDNQLEIEKIEKGSFVHKLSTNYAIENGMQIIDKDGNVGFFANEYYYKQKVKINEIYNKGIKFLCVKKQKLADIEGYKEFELEIPKIKQLVPGLQLFFWKKMLLLANHCNSSEDFNKLYSECCDYVREDIEIKRDLYVHQIEKDINSVDFDDIRTLCEMSKDYKLAIAYLSELSNIDIKKTEVILNDNQYLLNKNVGFLDVLLRIKKKKSSKNFSFVGFLLKYKERYKNVYEFYILLALYASKNKKYKSEYNKSLNFLKENEFPSGIDGVFLSYLIILYNNIKDYNKLKEIIELNPLLHFKIEIANCLQNSKIRDDLLFAKSIYTDILQENPNLPKINSYLFSVNCKLKCYGEAKQAILKELKGSFNTQDLKGYLQIKIETKDYDVDEHVVFAEQSIDSDLLMLVGIIYSNKEEYKSKAFDYFLKSLLINDKNTNSMKGIISLSYNDSEKKSPKKIEKGVVVVLENDKRKLKIAIHANHMIQNFTPSKFAGLLHFKESDKNVEDLLFSSIGDDVVFKHDRFKVKAVENIKPVLFSFVMAQMANSNDVKTFSGPFEESKKQIIEYLETSKRHTDEIVKGYNESKCNLPITMFSHRLGKKIIECYSFLYYENNHRIKNLNNNSMNYQDKKGFILSFDMIYALAILDIDVEILNNLKCYCSLETKRIFSNELDNLITSAKSPAYAGYVCVRDGKLYRKDSNEEAKKIQLKFYNRAKRILDTLKVPDKEYSYRGRKELESIFYECDLLLEEDTLGFVQNNNDMVFVNDDPFISSIILLDKYNAVGITAFLVRLNLGFEKFFECIKQLSFMNYGNYITNDVYLYIKQAIISANPEKQKEYLKMFYELLTSSHFDENSENWKHNNQVIREIIKQNKITPETNDLVDKVVFRAVVNNFAKEFPQEYSSIVEDVNRRFRIRLVEKNNETYLETFLEEDKKED